jgi:hypothetical protein
MKSAVLSQQFAVTIFGEGVYFIVLHEGQIVTVNCISHQTEAKNVRFSLNIVLDILMYLNPINFLKGVMCTDRLMNYTYG